VSLDGLDICRPLWGEIGRGDEMREGEAMKTAQAEAEVFSDEVKGGVNRGRDAERHHDAAFLRRSDPCPVGGSHDGTFVERDRPLPDYDQDPLGR
jgi:hypothetical protein